MQIGKITLPKTAALAPMAGVADTAFRLQCKKYGACYTVGEMASAKGLTMGSRKSAELLTLTAAERPAAIQLFGSDPQTLAEGAEMAMVYSPDVLDINMGCPAPKVAGHGGGSALMKDPAVVGDIVKAVTAVSPVPVSVKIRAGWDDSSRNAVEIAKICEANGAAFLTVHGRTRMQMYAPPVDIDIIRAVKEAVSIPVIGNGDVVDAASAVEMYEKTGCDLVMVGRGALGRPWVFAQIAAFLERGEILPEPPLEEKMNCLLEQVAAACEIKGEYVALREARGHASWYMKGLRGAASLRREASALSTYEDLQRFAASVLERCQ